MKENFKYKKKIPTFLQRKKKIKLPKLSHIQTYTQKHTTNNYG